MERTSRNRPWRAEDCTETAQTVMAERYLYAYFHEFQTTGNDAVDAILEAVAMAGKAYHYTGNWSDAGEHGPNGYWSLIQQRANEAARAATPKGDDPQ